MVDPEFLFHKNDFFNVAICKKCHYGVPASMILDHILDKHKNETEESAEHIAKIVSTWNVRNDRKITYSSNAIDQQEHLPLYSYAFKCNHCNYIFRGLSQMRAHCRDQHNWNLYESKTGRLNNRPWREHIYCQRIFPKSFGCLFEVKADAVNLDLVQQAATLDSDFLFHKNDFFNVAICKKCRCGVLSSKILDHILDKHENDTEESAKHIAEIVSTWKVRNDKSITFSNYAIDQQEYLPLYGDGLKCNECKYIFRHIGDMRAHCRDQHKWNPYESNTGSLVNGPWLEHVCCQKIFPKGHLFEVKRDSVSEDIVQQATLDPDFLFHKNELFNVAICKQCQHGVLSCSIAYHIRTKHENETEESAINIAEIVSTWNVRNDRNITYSNNAIDQQEHLPLYRDALQCNRCKYIFRNLSMMRVHCKDQHKWNPYERKIGRLKNGPWREHVLCQQMFGMRSKYFEVRPKVAVAPDLPQKSSDASMPSSPADASSDMTEDNDDLAQKVWDSTISTLAKAYRLGIHLRGQSLLLNLNETEDRFVTEEHTFEELTTCFASLMVFFVRARNVRFTSRQLADWNNYKRLVKNYEQDHKDVEEACTRFCISLLDDQRTGNSETTLVKAMTFNGEPELIVLLGWLKGARWMVLNFVSLPIDKIKEVYPIVCITRPQELLEIFTKRFVSSATPMRWLLDQIETIGRF